MKIVLLKDFDQKQKHDKYAFTLICAFKHLQFILFNSKIQSKASMAL